MSILCFLLFLWFRGKLVSYGACLRGATGPDFVAKLVVVSALDALGPFFLGLGFVDRTDFGLDVFDTSDCARGCSSLA